MTHTNATATITKPVVTAVSVDHLPTLTRRCTSHAVGVTLGSTGETISVSVTIVHTSYHNRVHYTAVVYADGAFYDHSSDIEAEASAAEYVIDRITDDLMWHEVSEADAAEIGRQIIEQAAGATLPVG